jgi:hypothetical protein
MHHRDLRDEAAARSHRAAEEGMGVGAVPLHFRSDNRRLTELEAPRKQKLHPIHDI